jgi:multiple sugar transport system substrate-binding protein
MHRYQQTALVLLSSIAMMIASLTLAQEWSLEEAAEPYRGTTINAIFLDRPGYAAAIELIPEFTERTGINVVWDTLPYEISRERQILEFTAMGDLDLALIDLVWIGEFAEAGWITPLETFINDPELADPNLNLDGFVTAPFEAFGVWGDTIYGLPFDNYGGLMFYNQCMLEAAGFDGPPETWTELLEVYGPALTDPAANQYAFALQSRRGETQSADSFMRVLWPFGGSLIDEATFEPNLLSEESQQGLQFRQDLMAYMPPDIVDYDHSEAVEALAQGRVAMITEWSAFYATLTDPAQSTIGDCLAITTEPRGPDGLRPALGGFSLGVASHRSEAQQAASWLFIQWITSEEKARDYVMAGGVSARASVYEDEDLLAMFPYFEPLVEAWQTAIPHFRPRFAEWPEISEIIADWGTRMMLGEVSVEDGASAINERVRTILSQAGYYDGRKELLQ